MKHHYTVGIILCYCLGILCYSASPGLAIEAYFDTAISTKLEPEPDTGTIYVTRLAEEVPQVFPDIVYEPVIYVEIIFDASKTMEEPDINGIPKIEIAKKIVSILVNYFPQRDARYALRVNGARYPNNCLDSELVIPFGRENAQQVLETLKTIQPKGLSPVTYSLRQVLQDFEGTKGTKMVFMITDGQETCDVEPVDACTTTMDLFQQAEFEGAIHIIGINTIDDYARELLDCLSLRGQGEFLDSNRNKGSEFAELIQRSQQLSYSISKVLDPETLLEGKILELINRRIGDITIMDGDRVVLQPERLVTRSSHELEPGIYKIEFATVPVLASYFTLDRQQELTIALVRSGYGLDLYDRAHLALGNKYYDNGQIEEAVAEYQKVIEFDPRNVDAHLNLGIIYDDILKNKEKAAEYYKTYLELQGPRQDEVREWLRKVRGEPTREEELAEKAEERKEEKAQEEAKRLAEEERARRAAEHQKGLAAHREILTANPEIRELSEEEVMSGKVVHVTVSNETTDSKARAIVLDVGRRIKDLLTRTPDEVIAYRENRPDVPVAHARYDVSQQEYVIVGSGDVGDAESEGVGEDIIIQKKKGTSP